MQDAQSVGPPSNSVAATVTDRVVLIRGNDALVVVNHFDLWPSGMRFNLAVKLRSPAALRTPISFSKFAVDRGESQFHVSMDLDGVTDHVSNFGEDRSAGFHLQPSGLTGSYGEGDTASWDVGWWLSPIPGRTIRFLVHCEPLGIYAVHADLNVSGFRDAASAYIPFEHNRTNS